jgi:hypothetical protein
MEDCVQPGEPVLRELLYPCLPLARAAHQSLRLRPLVYCLQFNAIDCQPNNPKWCCAVGEADSDSPVPGARIHCTQDGGASWNQTFYAAGTSSAGYSLMEIAYATDNDVWAVGGELGLLSASAWFLYSADGGITWTQSGTPMTGYMGLGLSFVDPTHAFAALDNTLTQTSAIAGYA